MRSADARQFAGVGAALIMSVLAGCSAAPSAEPVSSPQTSVAPSSPPATSTTGSPTAVASEAPSPSLAATESASPTPTPTPSTPQTNNYATSFALSGNKVSYTRLRWYWGKAAQARCKQQHIHSEIEWCNDYYYENTHRKGRGTLAADAKIRLLDDSGQLHTGTATELAASIRSETWPFYRIWSAGDQIVRLEQVFTP